MKKAIALLLSLVFAFSTLPMALAVTFADEAKWPASAAWAKDEIHYMAEKEVLNGYAEDGTFRPDDPVTRAQFIKMIAETFGLTATTPISYSDVPSTEWFYPYIAKAKAQGFLLEDYGTKLNPNGELTREEAAALLARYLDLDATQKVATSTYSDYNSISAKYKEYVLQASYVGLFQGDADGKFSPSRILKRCEAAAILYRAAGTIYRASTVGTDAAAGDKNAVIAKSGITVSDAVIKGTLIVCEGAATGTINITGCIIDTLEIRGTASLNLTGSTVSEIVVKSANASHTTEISLLAGSDIGDVVAETPVKLNMVSGVSVDSLLAEVGAVNSSVNGTGTLGDLTVKSTGFTSAVMPSKYALANGISATLAGTTYTGTGTDTVSNGFSRTPATYANTTGCFMAATPSATGTMYYYFTNTATAPTASAFMTAYTAAAVKAQASVTANVNIERNLAAQSAVSGYSHVAVMISGYDPLVITNASYSGFISAPVMSTATAYAQLAFTPAVSGSVYYYFTNTATVPSTTSFATTYNSSNTLYKGKLDVVANQAKIENTVSAASVSAYNYVVVLLLDEKGVQYPPVLIAKNASSSTPMDTGFTTTPYSEMKNNSVALSLQPSANATVRYYFTNTATTPTNEQFETRLAAADVQLTDTFAVTGGTVNSILLANQTATKLYKYVVLVMTAVTGEVCAPVLVALPETAALNVAGTGFLTVPTTSLSAGYYYLTVRASAGATLQYYLSNNEAVPSQTVFNMNYTSSVTSPNLAVKNGGIVTLTTGSDTFKTAISQENGANFNYMVLMLKVGAQTMNPIVIPLVKPEESNTPVVNEGTGFLVNPVYSATSREYHTITFTSKTGGSIWFYYTEDSTIPTTERVIEIVQTEMGNANPYAGYDSIYANYPITLNIEVARYLPKYVVMMIMDANGVCYNPVIIPTNETASSASASGFASTPTLTTSGNYLQLNYNTLTSGLLYYYFSNTATVPSASTFPTTYWSTAENLKGYVSVNGGSGTKTMAIPAGYYYLVVMMYNSAAATTSYQPVVLPLYGGSGSNTAMGSGFSGALSMNNGSLWFNALTTGTLAYYFTNEDSAGFTGGATNSFTGTAVITQTGMQSVNIAANFIDYWPMISAMYKNIVVYIHNGTTILNPVVVPLNGGTTVPGVPGTGSGTTPLTGYGFSVVPTYSASTRNITFQTSVTSEVRYFVTNAETQYTAMNFEATYNSAYMMAQGGSQGVLANNIGYIYNHYTNYKYMWIQLGNYAPYRVTIG